MGCVRHGAIAESLTEEPIEAQDQARPQAPDSGYRTWAGILAVLFSAAVLWQAWLKFYSYQDDAFIFFRYAENALNGAGLVFNPGERVEGFSSPLWLLVLVLAGAAGLSPLHAAGIFGTLATVAVVLLSVRDARRCGPPGPVSFLAPVGLVLFFPFVAWSVSGMETSLFTAWVWGALSGHRIARAEARRPGRDVGLCLAAALLTRPEAVLLVLALLADEVAAARSTVSAPPGKRAALVGWAVRLSWLLPAVLAGAALLAARLLYYGALLPNTFYAKLGGDAAHAGLGLRYLGSFVIAAPLIAPAALLLVPRFGRRVPGGVAALVLVVLWSCNLVWFGGDHFPYHRFLVPLAPLLFALGATGLHETWSRLAPHIEPGRRSVLGACLLLACLALVARAAPDPAPGRPQHGFDWTLASARLGQRLATTVPPPTLVALPHIGAVGYYSRLPVLDLLGLVDRDLARRPRNRTDGPLRGFNEIGHECFDIAWSLARRPDVIVPSRTYGSRPFTNLSELRPDFPAEAQLFEVLGRRSDYRLINVPIGDGAMWALFVHRDLDDRQLTAPGPAPVPR
jgi:arabinofuranosyltransferase